MLSSDFSFFAPADLSEALGLLAEHEDAKVLAGGMSIVPMINLGLARPSSLVSLNHVPGLDHVEDDGDALRIGALVRHARVKDEPLIRTHLPLLADAAAVIADVPVRNRGTIGGSVAHADPAADYLPVLVVLGASVVLASAAGRRTVPAREFFQAAMTTALEPGEVVVEVLAPKVPDGAGSAYVRLARVEGSFAIVNAAAIVDGERSALAVGGAVSAPVLVASGAGLAGMSPDAIGDAAEAACRRAYSDLSGSADYRRAMARVYARRAVERAIERGAGR
jgi:carbon-monoxide dehydrogenase medium subunit